MRDFPIGKALLLSCILLSAPTAPPVFAQKAPTDLSAIVAPLLPEVVNVSTVRITQTPNGPHRDLSAGSGFIVDPAGIIVTNNHVVDGSAEITVTLHDSTVLPATLLGQDELTDLAVLKVKSETPLPAVRYGDSEKLRIGQPVIAIGNPYAIGTSVSAGIVSALGRDMREGPYDNYIQTDAAINHGNSGGPLFDLQGEVVGVNSVVFSPTEQGGSVGLGFAIPANEARFVATQLAHQGYVRRGWLGARIQDLTPAMAESVGLPRAQGAMVVAAVAGSPAAKAGLEAADVILAFAGREMQDFRTLSRAVATQEIGASVPMTIWRDGKQIDLTVTIAERPGDHPHQTGASSVAPAGVADSPDLGLTVERITPALRTKFKLDNAQTGVVVVSVAPDSAAADQGLHVGDVIVKVQRDAVDAPIDMTTRLSALRSERRQHVLMLVRGQDGLRWIALRLGSGM
ncbi:MAG TPA: Do family serine endopeptidase [Acetobacteraceae bacterium]|nr:Do family serine endopeptidase [Acetobacteraceae bacterium]